MKAAFSASLHSEVNCPVFPSTSLLEFDIINKQIIELDFDFIWNKKENQLFKKNEMIKLSKNEVKLFQLFIDNYSLLKNYQEIETFIFGYFENE